MNMEEKKINRDLWCSRRRSAEFKNVIRSLTSVTHDSGNLPCGFISLIHPGDDPGDGVFKKRGTNQCGTTRFFLQKITQKAIFCLINNAATSMIAPALIPSVARTVPFFLSF